LAKRPRWRARVDQALDWVRRYDAWFILAFRFIYGVRNFSSFALGISGIDWRRFMVFNFIAALVWAATFVGTGYVSGRAVHRLLGSYAERFSLSLLGCVAVILICVFLFRWARRRRLDAKSGKIPSAASP
jgi:membrane protein DedA with SNARE-associated domain